MKADEQVGLLPLFIESSLIGIHVTQTVRSASLRTGAHEVERRSDGSGLARQVRCVV